MGYGTLGASCLIHYGMETPAPVGNDRSAFLPCHPVNLLPKHSVTTEMQNIGG
ncbi:hypothetical protein SXCC_00424 [Gluconacetobacter sp. SXCC-1]|nr:hypothetical protein SXCC_00424 [Gluconacetobacter sp. SXCC-1]